MHSSIVTVLCSRVIDPCVRNWLDLPSLESLLMGFNALSFTPTTDSALIMRSNEANENWLSRLAQSHDTQVWQLWFDIQLSSSRHSWMWFSPTVEWCLDMPSLTDVWLTEYAFRSTKYLTITGSAHFIPVSRIGIGALADNPRLKQLQKKWSSFPLLVLHTSRNNFFIHLRVHSASLERALSLYLVTMSIWNDGNPIRIVETTTNDHSSKSLVIHTKPCYKSPTSHPHSNLNQIPIRQIHSVKHRNTTILFLSIPTIHEMRWNSNPVLHLDNPNQSSKHSYHTSPFHLNSSKLNLFSNQPTITQTQRTTLPSPLPS